MLMLVIDPSALGKMLEYEHDYEVRAEGLSAINPALDISYGVTTDADPFAPVFAEQFAATLGKLPGVQGAFANALRPIGNERAMR
jgi:hypothetical protein